MSLETSLSSKNISIQSASRIYILAGPVTRLSPNRRITGCLRIYYCYYYFVSLRSSPPASLPPSPFFFSTRSPRWRSGERPSDAGTPFVVWQRACENTTGIFHFSRRSRAPTTASRCHVTRHSFRDTYIYTATSRLPGVALINVEAFIKAARCEYSPLPFLRCSSSCCSSSKSLFLSLSRFALCLDITKRLILFFQGEYEDSS